MKETSTFVNPFRILSPKLDAETIRIEELHARALPQKVSLEEGVLIMISKLMEMTRLLSKTFVSGSHEQMDRCSALGLEVDELEDMLTKELIGAGIDAEVLKGVIRFPYRLERIGDMLESMLNCSRAKATKGIPFSDKAHAELDQLFAVMLRMMSNLRDVLRVFNCVLVESIVADGKRLNQMVEDFKLAHWERLEMGLCHVAAHSMYRDILDSAKVAGEYMIKMCETISELEHCEVFASPAA